MMQGRKESRMTPRLVSLDKLYVLQDSEGHGRIGPLEEGRRAQS